MDGRQRLACDSPARVQVLWPNAPGGALQGGARAESRICGLLNGHPSDCRGGPWTGCTSAQPWSPCIALSTEQVFATRGHSRGIRKQQGGRLRGARTVMFQRADHRVPSARSGASPGLRRDAGLAGEASRSGVPEGSDTRCRPLRRAGWPPRCTHAGRAAPRTLQLTFPETAGGARGKSRARGRDDPRAAGARPRAARTGRGSRPRRPARPARPPVSGRPVSLPRGAPRRG